jgi:hypothetical protein
MKTLMKGLIGTALIALPLGLGACTTDGTTTSIGVGISSYDGYYDGGYGISSRGDRDWDGIPNSFDRDRDGDGIPNRFDSRPNNPRWR